ncbi:MAG: alpha/beta hydrolase, partial [Sciscionella sp.]
YYYYYYYYVAEPWVDAGAVFVSCGYRLQPRHGIAATVDDAARAVDWVRQCAHRYGGDPHRITVAGHSAGGHLTAMVTMTDWPAAHPLQDGSVTGSICMSTPVDLRSLTPADADAVSPAFRVNRAPERVVVSFGDPEPNKKDADDRYLAGQGGCRPRLSAMPVSHRP